MNISVDILAVVFYSIALAQPETHLTEMLEGDYKMSNMIYRMTTT